MKILSLKNYRLNFKIDGLHYSLSEDMSTDNCFLICKETEQRWGFNHTPFKAVLLPCTKDKFLKKGATYRQSLNIKKLENFLKEIISGVDYSQTNVYKEIISGVDYSQTNAYKEMLISKHLKEINVYQRLISTHIYALKELGYDFSN